MSLTVASRRDLPPVTGPDARPGDTLWLPRSPCGDACLPTAATVPRAGRVLVTARYLAAAAVVLAAALTVPATLLLTDAARDRVVRRFARGVLRAFGIRHELRGRLPRRGALLVANHVSWIDVVVLLAYAPVRLLAKSEVRDWPVIGRIARSIGTIFIDRDRPRTLPQAVDDVAGALRAGACVAVFPEGTTWCGLAGGRYRPAMFQAAIDAGTPVAPVSLRFRLADGTDTAVAAFIGDDTLVASIGRVARTRGLRITVQAHNALYPATGAARRTLARAARAADLPPGGCG